MVPDMDEAPPTGLRVGPIRRPKVDVVLKLVAVALLITVAANAAGPVKLHIGLGDLTILPLVWALLGGVIFGLASPFLPRFVGLAKAEQGIATKLLQPALLLFITKLGLLVGSSLPTVLKAGWALIFQEFGHFLGTLVFGLPVALILGIKREAIGATFSVGREPSLAIIGERFGMNSPEGRGVLAEYLTGTVIGSVFIALFAGWLTSTGWLSPYALAMGAGIGSGTMMAAASAAIAAHFPPSVGADLATYAAASNLVTTTVGTYFTVLISLPLTIRAYAILEPILGRRRASMSSAIDNEGADHSDADDEEADHDDGKGLSISWAGVCWLVLPALALIGDWIGRGVPISFSMIGGMLIIVAISACGYGLYRVTRGYIPAIIWCSALAMLATMPVFKLSATVTALTAPINFLSLATPILAIAGLSIAKDVPAFRRLGWRIVVVSLCANAGTFLGASLIAQFFIRAP